MWNPNDSLWSRMERKTGGKTSVSKQMASIYFSGFLSDLRQIAIASHLYSIRSRVRTGILNRPNGSGSHLGFKALGHATVVIITSMWLPDGICSQEPRSRNLRCCNLTANIHGPGASKGFERTLLRNWITKPRQIQSEVYRPSATWIIWLWASRGLVARRFRPTNRENASGSSSRTSHSCRREADARSFTGWAATYLLLLYYFCSSLYGYYRLFSWQLASATCHWT